MPSATLDLERRGESEKIAAVSLLAVGGAAMVVGAVLVVLNQPRAVEVTQSQMPRVVPRISRQENSVTVGWDF